MKSNLLWVVSITEEEYRFATEHDIGETLGHARGRLQRYIFLTETRSFRCHGGKQHVGAFRSGEYRKRRKGHHAVRKPSAQPQESMAGHAQPEKELPTFYVDDMDVVFVKDPFDLTDYYITNRVIVDNRYRL